MKPWFFLFALFVLGVLAARAADGVGPPKPPFTHTPLNVPNGCFVESVAFYDEFMQKNGAAAWCRLLQWGAKEEEEVVAGHAVAVFQSGDKLWCWDVNFGFEPLDFEPAKRDDAVLISVPLTAKYPKISAQYPLYRMDFPQTPEVRPPGALDPTNELGLRDTARVAARLGLYRPVRLVQFTWLQDGVTVPGSACAFVFNGRLCVYTPTNGTVPFHVPALTVANLRQLQELLKRICPGTGALTVK
jgi:hypothetical protein